MNTKQIGRIVLLLAMGALIGMYFYFDLGQYLNEDLLDVAERYPYLSVIVFFMTYVIFTALSLPAATFLTITAGLLFGRVGGTLVVVCGASVGALLAFWAARFMVREWVTQRFSGKSAFEVVEKGIKSNGLYFLLFLRFVPLVPFFLINLVAGLTPITARVFFFGTFFGIAPGTFVYVNIGHSIGRKFFSIGSHGVASLLTADVFIAFGLLGALSLVPTLYKVLKSKKA